jgi:hypothetical protein
MWWNRFRQSEDGVSLVLVTITLPVIIGLALLVIDGSRVYSLHNDLQKGADALALAAGAELDGTSDAIERADRAIATLVQNRSNFSDDGLEDIAAADVTVRYLEEIPADDDDPITADFEVDMSDPVAASRDARFVEVEVNPKNLTAIFPASFLGADNSQTISASAVAGFGQAVCNFTPLYICNPYEGTGISLETVVADRSLRRQLIELRPGGGGSEFPGNFGYLQPPDGRGANALRDSVARVNPNACFDQDGVELQTGAVIGPVRNAINVRFDIYEGNFNGSKNNASYRPARNVRKGYQDGNGTNGACSPTTAYWDGIAGFMPLPRDDCFLNATCGRDITGSPLGDGDWALTEYWNVNHSGNSYPTGWADTTADRPTRYEVYRAEIDTPGLNSQLSTGTPRPEDGLPACYGGGTLSDDPDRRVIYGAILNCVELEEQYGQITGSSAPPMPVETFASFFLIEPISGSGASDPNIYVELVDISGRHGEGTMEEFVRDMVQLYR